MLIYISFQYVCRKMNISSENAKKLYKLGDMLTKSY